MEGRAHILSILGALSVQGSVMSVLAPRGVTQACGSSGLVGIGIGPESAWLDKKGGGETWGTQLREGLLCLLVCYDQNGSTCKEMRNSEAVWLGRGASVHVALSS